MTRLWPSIEICLDTGSRLGRACAWRQLVTERCPDEPAGDRSQRDFLLLGKRTLSSWVGNTTCHRADRRIAETAGVHSGRVIETRPASPGIAASALCGRTVSGGRIPSVGFLEKGC